MEMCFFFPLSLPLSPPTFRRVFRKDCLKEKSDVSFMASPSGKKCRRRRVPSPRIRDVRYRFLWRLGVRLDGSAAASAISRSDR